MGPIVVKQDKRHTQAYQRGSDDHGQEPSFHAETRLEPAPQVPPPGTRPAPASVPIHEVEYTRAREKASINAQDIALVVLLWTYLGCIMAL